MKKEVGSSMRHTNKEFNLKKKKTTMMIINIYIYMCVCQQVLHRYPIEHIFPQHDSKRGVDLCLFFFSALRRMVEEMLPTLCQDTHAHKSYSVKYKRLIHGLVSTAIK
jgi:hypothetical protein